MTKQEVKEQISKLVEKYNRIVAEGKKNSYNEAQTRNEFIEPLFEFLGWDMRNQHNDNEVTTEENVSGGRVDLAFRMNNIPVLFLEAKAMKVDLDEWKWAEQAINYSWNKGVTWAILTDFEGIKVFNAEIPPKSLGQNLFFEIKCSEYIKRFEQLWMLSKESFEQKLLDKEAQKWGKLTARKQVSDKLFEDLMEWRVILTREFKKQNEIEKDVLDEGVQRILDRLIFIRTAEDRKIEADILQNIYRTGKPGAYKHLVSVFRDFDDGFNSKLFSLHHCEDWKIEDKPVLDVLKGLYETKDGYRYDFKVISADVLGGIYEQYLGFVQGRNAEEKAHSKRKSQGIFYTPKYIVEYIVKETLGEVLKKTKEKDIHKIKILDPACGSGSFLQAAYDKILEHIQKPNLFTKFDILKDNIFGVDLDAQAVEITQLNLLLKVLTQKAQLPTLTHNICIGNSLISGKPEDLEKQFGPNWKEQKPLNFEQEYKDVFDQGGFDVIIGNPPYIRIQTLDKTHIKYFNEHFESPEKNYDIYILFIEKAYKLLKKGGILGLILPHKFFQGESGKKIREFIYRNKALYKIVDFGTNQVFENATTYTCLLFLQKKINKKFFYKEFKLNENFKNLVSKPYEEKDIEVIKEVTWNFSNYDTQNVLNKIKSFKNNFRSITKKLFKGSSTGNDSIFLLDLIKKEKECSIVFSTILNQETLLENALLQPFVYGEDIKRYAPLKSNKVLLFPYMVDRNKITLIPNNTLESAYPKTYAYLNSLKNELLKRKVALDNNNFYKYSAGRSLSEYMQPKIMIPDMLVSNRIGLDKEGKYFHGPAIHSVVFNESVKEHNPYFYLAILNSKLFWFFIANTGTALRGNAYRLTPEFLAPFCFPQIDTANLTIYKKLVDLADKMLQLNKELQNIASNTDKHNALKYQIENLDHEINSEVYKIYDLSAAEIAIVEA